MEFRTHSFYEVVERLYAIQQDTSGEITGATVLDPGTLVTVLSPAESGLLNISALNKMWKVVAKTFKERCREVTVSKHRGLAG